jgi:hypothetical protein
VGGLNVCGFGDLTPVEDNKLLGIVRRGSGSVGIAQFQALRYFALDGTDHASHREQASMIRRDIIWRNRDAHDRALRELVKRANVS